MKVQCFKSTQIARRNFRGNLTFLNNKIQEVYQSRQQKYLDQTIDLNSVDKHIF